MSRRAAADPVRLAMGLIMGFSLVSGCQHAEYAQRRLDQRAANLSWTVGQLEKSEASRPGNLNRTVTLLGDIAEEDAQQLDRNLRWMGRMIQSDARRFEERQPVYRRTILDILDGQPEAIEKTAIDLFY